MLVSTLKYIGFPNFYPGYASSLFVCLTIIVLSEDLQILILVIVCDSTIGKFLQAYLLFYM